MAVSEPGSQRPSPPQPRPPRLLAAGAGVNIESVATKRVSWLNTEGPTPRETDYHQVVEVLNDTNNSLTSYRTNQVMRVLTVVATIMLPLTLVASLYVMNVSWLPLATSHWAFWASSPGV